MAMKLIKWDELSHKIEIAKDISEIKSLSDKLEAIRILAKQSKQSLETQNKIARYRLKVERKKGEWLKENIEQGGDRKTKDFKFNRVELEKTGITPNESSDAQRIANIPKEEFKKLQDEIEKDGKEITKQFMVNTAKKIERAVEIQEQKRAIEKGEIELPEGKFEVIVIDPPWRYEGDSSAYDSKGFRGTTDYPTMSIEEIKNTPIPSSDDCVLWLWTTHRFMRYSFELLDTWGFEEKAILTWAKNKMGIGRWLRSKSEFCIMAVKGKPLINLTNQTTILSADVGKHSQKPKEFYDLVDNLCIGRKLDYFARDKRKGWEMMGLLNKSWREK